jgi:hypothetical protein
MIDYQTAREVAARLEAFRGRDVDEYSFLIRPLSEFIYRNGFSNLPEINKLAEAILAGATYAPETPHTETKPSVTAQFLADLIRPWIENIRQTLFHSKSAPFNSVGDTQAWWDEAERGIDEWQKRVDEWRKGADEYHRAMDEWKALFQAVEEKYPLLVKGTIEERLVAPPSDLPTHEEYQQLDEKAAAVDAIKVGEPPELNEQGKAYGALLDNIYEIAKLTGFTAESVEMYILADALPVLPALMLGIVKETRPVPFGTTIPTYFARVTIRDDLTFEELHSAYRRVRRELGLKRSKPFTAKHLQLYQLVRKKGGPVRGEGSVAFWESINRDWHNDKCKTWEGARRAYDRLEKKLSNRYLAKETKEEERRKQ